MSQDQNAGCSQNIKIDCSSLERVEQFKFLGTTQMDQYSNQEEIKSTMKTVNTCYHSVLNVVPYSLLSKNIKIKIYRTIILPPILYGCETWSLTLREEFRLRVLENRVLRRIFGSKRDKIKGKWRKLHNEELNDLYCSPHIILMIKLRRMRWEGHVALRGRCTNRVLVGKPEGNIPLGRLKHELEDNIKLDLHKWDGGVWTGLIWLRIGAGGGPL